MVETGSAVDIPKEILDELRLQVENAYQPVLDDTVASVENIEFSIPGHMIHTYKIHWIQQIYRSTISFSTGDQPCTTTYVYTLNIPEVYDFTEMACTA